jgi:hypothetical protein
MIAAGAVFGGSIALFLLYATVVAMEQRNARRLFGGRFRDSLDVKIVALEAKVARQWKHVTKFLVRLGWYYSIHSLLATLMRALVSVYTRIEHIFEKNRTRTKELRKEFKKHLRESHLTKMADHKEATSLSREDKETLLKKRLEQDH